MIFLEKFIIFLFHYFTVNLFFHLYLHLSLLSPAADCCFRIWHFFPNMGEESELTWDSVDFLCINYLIFVTNIKYICVIDICHKYIYTYMCINYLARLGIAEHGLCWVDMQGKTGTWTYLDKILSQICIARSLFSCTALFPLRFHKIGCPLKYLDKNMSQICIARSLFCCTARYINTPILFAFSVHSAQYHMS